MTQDKRARRQLMISARKFLIICDPTRQSVVSLLQNSYTIAARGVLLIRKENFQGFGLKVFYFCTLTTAQDMMDQIQKFFAIFWPFLKHIFIQIAPISTRNNEFLSNFH